MEVTMHLDNPTIREEGFFESKISDLENKIKTLEFDNAELVKSNEELKKRVTKLATRQPQWPKGYRPRRNDRHRNKTFSRPE